MMRFKKWFESLAGPGGGPGNVENPEAMAASDAKRGFGAFPTYGDNPPAIGKSPMKKYLDKRFYSKTMKKKMKKS
jgi:hypothetical protein